MKRLIFLFFLLSSSLARAGVPCSLPFNLQNGQPADATQVMANYNTIVACLGNAAAAGANADITSLSALTTPITPALGGTQMFVATAPSTGTNTIVVTDTTPTGFVLTRGFSVGFIAGGSNTDAATLQVGATAAAAVFRRTTDGPLPLVGGEIIAGAYHVATYDGTQFQLTIAVPQPPIGSVVETISAVADPGYLIMRGQCVQTVGAFNALWTKMGSPAPGACAAGQFPIPDGRGRVVAGIDSGGSNRITQSFDGTIIGNAGGVEAYTIRQSDLPNVSLPISDPGHVHDVKYNTFTGYLSGGGLGAATTLASTGTSTGTAAAIAHSTGITSTASINGGVPQTGVLILQPTIMLNRQIKY